MVEEHKKEGVLVGMEGEEDFPRDAKIVKSLLKSMGVREYESRVIHQFLEVWYRYVVDALSDAQVYSEHAAKSAIDCDDVKLAIQTKVNSSFSQPPPREPYVTIKKTSERCQTTSDAQASLNGNLMETEGFT